MYCCQLHLRTSGPMNLSKVNLSVRGYQDICDIYYMKKYRDLQGIRQDMVVQIHILL